MENNVGIGLSSASAPPIIRHVLLTLHSQRIIDISRSVEGRICDAHSIVLSALRV